MTSPDASERPTGRTYTLDEVRELMALAWDAGRYDETLGSAPVEERRAREVADLLQEYDRRG